jgi:hypothetical protein
VIAATAPGVEYTRVARQTQSSDQPAILWLAEPTWGCSLPDFRFSLSGGSVLRKSTSA